MLGVWAQLRGLWTQPHFLDWTLAGQLPSQQELLLPHQPQVQVSHIGGGQRGLSRTMEAPLRRGTEDFLEVVPFDPGFDGGQGWEVELSEGTGV